MCKRIPLLVNESDGLDNPNGENFGLQEHEEDVNWHMNPIIQNFLLDAPQQPALNIDNNYAEPMDYDDSVTDILESSSSSDSNDSVRVDSFFDNDSSMPSLPSNEVLTVDNLPEFNPGFNILTAEVVDAIAECLLTRIHECTRNGFSQEERRMAIIDELAYCINLVNAYSSL